MGAAKKVPSKGTGRGSQPFGGTGNFSAPPMTSNPIGIGSGLAKGVQKKAATDAFRGNDKSTQKGKGPAKRPLPPKPPINPVKSLPGQNYRPKPTQPGYGERIGASPDTVFTADFKDSDNDGIDDRHQAGPGLPAPTKWPSGPKDDYFDQDRFNKVKSGQVNLNRNERGNIEASRPPLPDGWLEDRRMQAQRNDQRNASENRMRRNDRRNQRKGGLGR